MKAIWDNKVFKKRDHDAREQQFGDEWERAVLQLERAMSDIVGGFKTCPLPACRQACLCVGNKPVCASRGALEGGAEQDLVEEFCADIRQERRDAAAEVAERIDRIWAEYVANPTARRRPAPRLRLLSDEPAPSVPWWWRR